MSDEGEFEKELAELRSLPKFQRVVLGELKAQFIAELTALGDAHAAEAEKHRGVLVFVANFYELLAGQPIVGDG